MTTDNFTPEIGKYDYEEPFKWPKDSENVRRMYTIEKLKLPDMYGKNYQVSLLTSVDGGDSYYHAGYGKNLETLELAYAYVKEMRQDAQFASVSDKPLSLADKAVEATKSSVQRESKGQGINAPETAR